MGVYLQLADKSEEPQQLATITGWGDVGRWADSLPPHTADMLVHLCHHGWQDQLPEMDKQVKAAVKAHPPKGDVEAVLTNLLSLSERAAKMEPPLVQVTNGMTE